MKLKVNLISMVVTTIFLAACHPYGDTKADLGITDKSLSASGLANNWSATNGDWITFSDSKFYDMTCNIDGQILYFTAHSNCPTDVASCGSMTLSRAPYYPANGCQPTGQVTCSFLYYAPTPGMPSYLQLTCADGTTQFGYSYQSTDWKPPGD